MSQKVLVTKSKLDSLADSVAVKSGVPVKMTVDQMKSAVDSIIVPSGTLDITENGEYDVTRYATVDVDAYVPPNLTTATVKSSDEEQTITPGNYDGFSSITVETIDLQTKTVTPTTSSQSISADSSYDGLSSVTVNPIPSSYIEPSGNIVISTNGMIDVSQYAQAVVAVPSGQTAAGSIYQDENGYLVLGDGDAGVLDDDTKIGLLSFFDSYPATQADWNLYYNVLYNSFYPPTNLDSISAVFAPTSGAITSSTTLDDLRDYLTVTAAYSDNTTSTVTDYLLSGTMGQIAVITVVYGGKSTKFPVGYGVSSLSAVYTQGDRIIYTSDDIDSFKDNLVVTATLEGGGTQVLTANQYMLSGNLTVYNTSNNVDTSTITVSAAGVTTTFTVVIANYLTRYIEGTLTEYSYDKDITFGEYSFYQMSTLTKVTVPSCTIEGHAFDTTALNALILTSGSVISTLETDGLINTPIRAGVGGVYVPTNMVATYKADPVWSDYLIYPISSYPVTNFETISDSWAEIFAAEDNGTYSTKYSIGDTKQLSVNGKTLYMQIVAFDTDVLASGTGTAKITWLAKGFAETHKMNTTSTNADGWAASEMRSWLRETVLPTIDSTVRSRILEVTKTYYDYTTSSTLSTSDTIWIPSYREVTGTDTAATGKEDSGVYYSGIFNTNDSTRIKYNITSGSASIWWLRSAYSGGAATFKYVGSSGGGSGGNNASITYGVVPGFCT